MWPDGLCGMIIMALWGMWHDQDGPIGGVRTRWLSCIDCAMWIMPRYKLCRKIIKRYYLKEDGTKRKFQLSWQKVYCILYQTEFLGFLTFLCVWGQEFFKPALKWIEHEDYRGFRAPEMPAQVTMKGWMWAS